MNCDSLYLGSSYAQLWESPRGSEIINLTGIKIVCFGQIQFCSEEETVCCWQKSWFCARCWFSMELNMSLKWQ